jgi:Pectinacetylesterase
MKAARLIATVATVAAVAAASGTIGAASATAPPTSEPAMTEPATTDSVAPNGGDALSADAEEVLAMESEFAQCMRDHGVDGYPDPHLDEDGFIVVGIPFGRRDDTEIDAGREACQHIYQQGGPGPSENAGEWEKIVPGGECECADGSEFAFWERGADPTKVVFYLDGGGGCWDAEKCAFTDDSTFYVWNIAEDDPASQGGIFDLANPDNPFGDYSFVYAPYCTGDVHLGDVTREYSPELTVEHNGYVNSTTALAYLAEHYPDAEQVVVVGISAGSIAAPVYGGLVADALPDAQVTVLANASGAYPSDPDVNTEVLGQWGVFETMPDWEVNEGLTASDWGPPQFWIQAGLHDPDIVLARVDYAYDENQTFWMEQIGADASNLVASMDANEAAIEAAGVIQHSFTAPGNDHGILDDGPFYTMEVNGVRLVDWVESLIAGEQLDDVHCDDCHAP